MSVHLILETQCNLASAIRRDLRCKQINPSALARMCNVKKQELLTFISEPQNYPIRRLEMLQGLRSFDRQTKDFWDPLVRRLLRSAIFQRRMMEDYQ